MEQETPDIYRSPKVTAKAQQLHAEINLRDAKEKMPLYPDEARQSMVEGRSIRTYLLQELAQKLELKAVEDAPNAVLAIEAEHRGDDIVEKGKRLVSRLFRTNKMRTSIAEELALSRGVDLKDADYVLLGQLLIIRGQEGVYGRLHDKSHHEEEDDTWQDKVKRTLSRFPVRADSLGKVWKDFCAVLPRETLRYTCDMAEAIDVTKPENVAKLLYAAGKAYKEISPYASEAGQPLGPVEALPGKKTRVITNPLTERIGIPMLITRRGYKGEWETQTVMLKNGQSYDDFEEVVKDKISNQDGWKPLEYFDEAVFGVSITPTDRLYSQGAIRPAFDGTRKLKPWCVFQEGNLSTRDGVQHLQAAFDHFVCDGMAATMFINGGELNVGKGEQKKKVKIKGLKEHFKELSDEEMKEPRNPDISEDKFQYDVYKQVVVAERKRDYTMGADTMTYAALFALDIFIQRNKEKNNGIWDYVTAACNYTATPKDNPLAPLAAGSSYLNNPEMYSSKDPFYNLRHIIGLTNSLDSFKYTRWQIDNYDKNKNKQKSVLDDPNTSDDEKRVAQHIMPPGMETMASLTESKLPERLQKDILVANRWPLLTAVRAGMTFVPTIICETGSSVMHPTVAGRDLPNIVIQQKNDELAMIFSVDPDSKFVPPKELSNFAKFVAPVVYELTDILHDWQQNKYPLEELNEKIDELYQRQKEEVKKYV